MTSTRTLAVAATLAVFIAQAAVPAETPHQEFLCVRGAEQRIIAIYYQFNDHSSVGCRVVYTKSGQSQTLWSSQSTRGYCTGKATQLVTRLAQDEFQCTPRTIDASEDASH